MSARQLQCHGHSMPSRGLRSIKFFSDLVNEAFAIGQVKEIAGHLAQRRRFDRVPVLTPTVMAGTGSESLALANDRSWHKRTYRDACYFVRFGA